MLTKSCNVVSHQVLGDLRRHGIARTLSHETPAAILRAVWAYVQPHERSLRTSARGDIDDKEAPDVRLLQLSGAWPHFDPARANPRVFSR